MLFQKNGFTLAEVLIALVIIGVIAAITVPVLMNNMEEKELKSSLKKNYSILKQFLNNYYIDEGEKLIPSDFLGTSNTHPMYPLLKKYIIHIKDCGTKSCVSQDDFASVYKTFNNKTGVSYKKFDDGQYVLSDGSTMFVENSGVGVVYISVDVNGHKKKPNRLGKDLFMFQIDNQGELLPMGTSGTDYYDENDAYCSSTSTNNMNGAGCTYKALQE